MKFRKTIVMLLAIVMVLGLSISALALNTQEKNQWLIDKGYVKGRLEADGKVDFAFNDLIDRDEMTRMLVLAAGWEKDIDSYKNITTRFLDVPQDHWGIGEINLASSKGLIIGYEDSTFKPDNKVTFAEVCTMLVRLDSRWKTVNVSQLAWPQGYINLAKDYGILDGVVQPMADAQAVRSMVFEMIYNSVQTRDSANQFTVTFDYNVKEIPNEGRGKNDYEREYKLDKFDVKVKKNEIFGISNFPANKVIKDRYENKDDNDNFRELTIVEWNTKTNGRGYALKPDTKISENITYYAIWGYTDKVKGYEYAKVQPDELKAVHAPLYTEYKDLELPNKVDVTYYKEDGTRDGTVRDVRIDWNDKDYSRTEAADQTIRGELYLRDLKDDKYFPEDLLKFVEDRNKSRDALVTITVKRETDKAKITYDLNGYTIKSAISPNPVTVEKNKDYKLVDVAADGYTFKGWSLTRNGTVVANPYKPTKDITLYAIFEKVEVKPVEVKVTITPVADLNTKTVKNGTVVANITVQPADAILSLETASKDLTLDLGNKVIKANKDITTPQDIFVKVEAKAKTGVGNDVDGKNIEIIDATTIKYKINLEYVKTDGDVSTDVSEQLEGDGVELKVTPKSSKKIKSIMVGSTGVELTGDLTKEFVHNFRMGDQDITIKVEFEDR